jgi:hypothetical protein
MEKRPPDRPQTGGSKELESKTPNTHHAKNVLERKSWNPRKYWASVIDERNEPADGSVPFGLRRLATPFS